MSFAKAKIQRFNDTKVCTPSPAKYNVSTIQEKLRIGIMGRTGSYRKKKESPLNSEVGSVQSTPCFQTPTVPLKKKKLLKLSFRGHSKQNEQGEELREKIVECSNKDLYIKELEQHIEEIGEQLRNVNEQHERLQAEKVDREMALHAERQKNNEQLGKLFGNVQGANGELTELKKQFNKFKDDNLTDLCELLGHVAKFQTFYKATVETCKIQEENIRAQFLKKEQELNEELKEKQAKINLLQENFKDVCVLDELQMKQKIEEVETNWKKKLEEKEQEYEAILKECQAISEYNIIQSEIEKNQVRKDLEEKEKAHAELKEEINELKSEKHAYQLSITTFKDTIEVLKKRLINSDRDVEQLKEELESSEEKNLKLEEKCVELTAHLLETQTANEELELQIESTSKHFQKQIKTVEGELLAKVEALKREALQLKEDKRLMEEVFHQHREQQALINEAQDLIFKANLLIESSERKEKGLESELKHCQFKLEEEIEEGAEIRKKYIETSGKYDALAQQFEQLLQELDVTKTQIAAYQLELEMLTNQHVSDLKAKYTDQLQKNLILEDENLKLSKVVEKLKNKDVEKGKKGKENVMSPKCLKVHSPGPLKNKN